MFSPHCSDNVAKMTSESSRFQISVCDQGDKVNRNVKLTDKNVLGYYSVNGKCVYCANHSQLKYNYYNISKEQNVQFDLNHAIDSTIKKKSCVTTWNNLTNMFIWLSLNKWRIFPVDDVLFFTFRGNITKIMCSPYEDTADWTICAKLRNGVIYLNSFDTEYDIKRKQTASDFELRCQRWGFKFEQYALTSDPSKKPNFEEVLNENEMFCCVMERQLSNHRLIYGAEMDGVVSNETLALSSENLSNLDFVELKTSRSIENTRKERSFRRFKLLKWWCQSYLSGVETIICGFRDDNGIVWKLKRYKVSELPSLAHGLWDKNVCINFCVRFLNFVKRVILENRNRDANTSDFWKFDFNPHQKRICASKVTDDVSVYNSGFMEI